MPRVKGGVTTRRRRKKILKLAKGYIGSRRALYRTAHEQVMRALANSYKDRKRRKRDFRKLWISRINAAAKLNGLSYSRLIHGLALANVEVNRKVLADIAVHAPADFTVYVETAKKAIANGAKPAKVEKAVEPKKVVEPKKAVESVDLSKLTVAELKELADKKGIELPAKALKADIVELLSK